LKVEGATPMINRTAFLAQLDVCRC